MLHLASTTDPGWVHAALAGLADVLLDHAHCEKKAAANAINLIFRYPEHTLLLDPLSRLAREELAHFEEVLRVLEARGIKFGRQVPSDYPADLMRCVRTHEPQKLLDTLLCCAFIEARSCERMKILAAHLPDPALAFLYEGLLAAEARHHRMYVDLALLYFPEAEVRPRLLQIAEHEAEVLRKLPRSARLHAG